MKTKTLSTLRQSSTRYAAKNSWPAAAPRHHQRPALKASASVSHTAHQASASRIFISCGSRWNTPRSSASIAVMKRKNAIQAQEGMASTKAGGKNSDGIGWRAWRAGSAAGKRGGGGRKGGG